MKSKKAKNECTFSDFPFCIRKIIHKFVRFSNCNKLFKTKVCNTRDAIHTGRNE